MRPAPHIGPLYQAPRQLCQHVSEAAKAIGERPPDPLTNQLPVGWAIGTWYMAAGQVRMLCIASQKGGAQKEAASDHLTAVC